MTPLTAPIVRITDPTGNAFIGGPEHGQDLVPGHVVRVSGGPVTKTLTLVPLSITSVDIAENTVTGTAVPGAPVSVDVNNPPGPMGGHRATTAGGSGNWSVDFDTGGPPFDITGLTHAGARATETGPGADGDATVAHRGPRSIDANPRQNWVSGNGFSPGTTLAVTIFTAPGGSELFTGTTGPVAPNGFFFFPLDPDQPGQDVVAGRHVRVEPVDDPAGAKELTIVELAITRVGLADDKVEGTSGPSVTSIQVNVDKPAHHVFLTATPASGSWSVDLGALLPPFDVDATTHVNARTVDDDGDGTVADSGLPVIDANPRSDWVDLGGFTPGPLTLRIRTGPGGAELFSTTVFADSNGNLFHELDREDPNQDLRPGRHLEVSDGGGALKELTIVDLAITAAFASDNTVRGTAAAGDLLISVGDGFGFGAEIRIETHPGGPWSVDFDSAPPQQGGPFDIERTTFVNARLVESGPGADGDATVDGVFPAVIDVDPRFDDIHIQNFPAVDRTDGAAARHRRRSIARSVHADDGSRGVRVRAGRLPHDRSRDRERGGGVGDERTGHREVGDGRTTRDHAGEPG